MDSLSQITLGAAVGEAILGKKTGNKAMLWGAICGTIPDLDVLAMPFLNDIDRLVYHRGISHSFTFALLLAPLLGWLIAKIHRQEKAGWRDWTWLAFGSLFTHPLLDNLTIWGTQFFLPFSDYRVALNSVFIVDPFYTVPFFAFLLAAMFFRRTDRKRRVLNALGLSLSTLYLALGLAAKLHADNVFEKALAARHIDYTRYMSAPAPLSIILWNGIAETEDGFWQGNYSLLDADPDVAFSYVPKNHHLIAPYRQAREMDRFIWANKGYFTVEPRDGALLLNDLRFGRNDAGLFNDGKYVFVYRLQVDSVGQRLHFERVPRTFYAPDSLLPRFFARVMGRKTASPAAVAQQFYRGWNAKDAGAVRTAFAPAPAAPRPGTRTAAALDAALDKTLQAFPALQFALTAQEARPGGELVVHWRMSGAGRNGAFAGRDTFKIARAKIEWWRGDFDPAALLEKTGMVGQ